MNRVLFVDHVDRVLGGAEINLLELMGEAQRKGNWEMACAGREQGPLGKRVRQLGVRMFDYGFGDGLNTLRFAGRKFPWAGAWQGWLALRRASDQLSRIIARYAPDAVISCAIKDHLATSRAVRKRFVPSIWWVNDLVTEDFFSSPARMAVRMGASSAKQIVAVSECVAAPFRQWHLGPQTRVIHNGIPLERYRRVQRGTVRKQLGIGNEEPLFGIVGRFCPWKGQRVFLEMAEAWVRSGRAGHFALIGQAFNEDKPYELDLRHFVADSSLRERAHFIPFEENMAGALSDLDVLIHASTKPEPFGRVIIEAMAAGVPVIAADAGGPREIITDEVNGLLAKPGDPVSYYEKLKQITSINGPIEQIVGAGRNSVETRFTVSRVAREFEKVIDLIS